MKRILALLAAGLCLCAHAADDWKVDVGTTNSTTVVPYALNFDASWITNTWTTNTSYAATTYVKTGSGSSLAYYWTPNGGTSGTNSTVTTNYYNPMTASYVMSTNWTEQPVHSIGSVTGDDGIIWKRCVSSGRGDLLITAETSATIYYSIDKDASTASGGMILPQSPTVYLEGIDGEINFYMASGTSVVHVVEMNE